MFSFIIKTLIYIFNIVLEIKYKIKVYITNKNQKNEIDIKNIYIINKNTSEIINLDLHCIIKKLNDKIKYNHQITLNNYLESLNLKKNSSLLVEIDYKKYGKDYIFNFELCDKKVMFPFYNIVDIKNKNMNKIMFIECIDNDDGRNEERIRMLERYGGPLNDFYALRGLGIKLGNIYSVKERCFLFRGVKLKMEDTFLNEYEVGENNMEEVFKIKGGLEDVELKRDEENEKYIMGKYKKFNMDGMMFVRGIYKWIYNAIYGIKCKEE